MPSHFVEHFYHFQHWKWSGRWRKMVHVSCTMNTMAADDLATHGRRSTDFSVAPTIRFHNPLWCLRILLDQWQRCFQMKSALSLAAKTLATTSLRFSEAVGYFPITGIDCLFNSLFRLTIKKTKHQIPALSGLCDGNPSASGKRKAFQCLWPDDVHIAMTP